MKIAVIGGGTKCAQLLNIIDQHQFKEIHPKVVGVADLKSDAPGLLLAKAKGLFTTNNYEDLFARDDIDLIIELTGNTDIINDILEKRDRTSAPSPPEPHSFSGKSPACPPCRRKPARSFMRPTPCTKQ